MPASGRRTHFRLTGRVLFLTRATDVLGEQLAGGNLGMDCERALLDNISTDEMTPGWVCYYYDGQLAHYVLVGLRGGVVQEKSIASGGFEVIVGGRSMGCGSSREPAPYAMMAAGVRLVVARSFEKIFRQNAQNIGLLTTTDFSILERLMLGQEVAVEQFTHGLDPISASIVEFAGLFAYDRERMAGRLVPPPIRTASRAMTLSEKILACHAVQDAITRRTGLDAVQPGDALFVACDVRFSHEYVTPMAVALLRGALGQNARVTDPESVFMFRDHLTLLDFVMPDAHVQRGLREQARSLAVVQSDFAALQGVRLHGEVEREGRPSGSEAICHNEVIDSIALPGQVVLGTDSHTCMAGAIGCFAFGVGATDMAAAWHTRDVRVTVPASVRIDLRGALRPGVAAKDVMLKLLSTSQFVDDAIGKVLEFGGDGLSGLPLDERATLANMAVEAGAFTAIMEVDPLVIDHIAAMRGIDPSELQRRVVKADAGATYAVRVEIDLAEIEPMVALPGDPRNGVPLRGIEPVRIDIAYGGSCTGGKRADMDMYAEVLRSAVAQGKTVAPGVALFLQFGSQNIRRYAEQKGYIPLFERAGATLLEPSCGACIRAGPGVSTSPEQVTVSAVNRNFPGRSGPGKVYLASPYVVVASAIAGTLSSADAVFHCG